MITLTPQELEKMPQCKIDWMNIHKCTFELKCKRQPLRKDCLNCTLLTIYESTLRNNLVEVVHCIEVLQRFLKQEDLID